MLYNYDFLGGKNNSYVFATSHGIVHEVKFKPSVYINFFDKSISDFIFEFVIELSENNTGKNPPLEKKIQ